MDGDVVVYDVGEEGVEEAACVGGATGSAGGNDVPDGKGGKRGVVVGDDLRTRRGRNRGGRGRGDAHVSKGDGTRGA